MNDNYKQIMNIHCPDEKCEGMLLQGNLNWHIMKCNKCERFWLEKTMWVEMVEKQK